MLCRALRSIYRIPSSSRTCACVPLIFGVRYHTPCPAPTGYLLHLVPFASAEREWAEERATRDARARDAEKKADALAKQNALLHAQIEDAAKAASAGAENLESAGGSASGSGGKLHEVVAYLRQEKESALGQVEVLSLEQSRWRRAAEQARAEADEARARLRDAEGAAGKSEAEGERKLKALMAKVEHLNVVQESNGVLRAELDACLLSDYEWNLGPEQWLRLPDPFVPWHQEVA